MESNKTTKNNKIPKLTIVSSYFYPKIGGLETIAYTTGKALHESGGYTVSVITSNYDSRGYKKEIIDGMTVHRLPIWFNLSNTPVNLFWYWWVKKIYKDEGTNIIHSHSPVPYLVDVAVSAAYKSNIPTIVTYHSGSMKKGRNLIDFFIGFYENHFLRRLFRIANEVVTVHQAFMRKNYPEVAHKTTFIPTGVDLSRFKKSPLPSHTEIVTFVGRIEHSSSWKGIEQLLEAMVLVLKKRPKAHLELVGGGDALEHYRAQSKKLGIGASVDIPGPMYGHDLIKVYERASVVVLPSTSDSEAFSVTLVESMASGRPIIGTNIGGTPQVIENEKNGLLVESKNSVALADAILRVLGDKTFAQKLADYGAEKSKEFSWDIQLEKYKKLFEKYTK